MKKVILVVVVAAVSLLFVGYGTFSDKIPNSGVYSCDTCHDSGYALNSFGSDFDDNGQEWNSTLAELDSDGGGVSNGEELLDLSGDWGEGDDDPGDESEVTSPGDADDD